MAGYVYFKSLVWLIGLSGLGYGLMVLTSPSQDKINEIKAKSPVYISDDEKRTILFMKHFKKSTENSPIDLQKSESDKKN